MRDGSAWPRKGEPPAITTSRSCSGSRPTLPVASVGFGGGGVIVVVVVLLVCVLNATAGVSPGEKLRVSELDADDAAAVDSAGFAPPAIVTATSAMKRGVGM